VQALHLYWRLTSAYVRSEMQYRVSFVLRLLGSFAVTIVDFAGIAVVLSRIPLLAGWSLGGLVAYEMAQRLPADRGPYWLEDHRAQILALCA